MKYRNVGFLLLLVAVLVLIPGWSAAADQNATIPGAPTAVRTNCQKWFKIMDANHDGKITKEELKADMRFEKKVDQIFQAKDLDKKGYLTEEDFCKRVSKSKGEEAKSCKALFERLDTGHHGYLTPAEFATGNPTAEAAEFFKGKDTNGDGKLTLEEFCGSRKTQKPPTK